MDILKGVISAVCISAVVYGVTMLLSPEGSMGKSFKNAVGIAVVATVIFSLSAIKSISLDVETFNLNSDYSAQYSNALSSIEVVNTCKAYIGNILESNNIKNADILVSTNILDSGSIIINEVTVVCQKQDISLVKELLSDIGTNVKVTERE